ncbi:hypothetical protein BJP46_25115 [Paenibacillus odorifer]|nr:hypothetical protein BJP46_25115 [Paenibacillus odorifer]
MIIALRVKKAFTNGQIAYLSIERRLRMPVRVRARDGYEETSIVAGAMLIRLGIFETSMYFIRITI